MSSVVHNHTPDYVLGRGTLKLAILTSLGVEGGARYLGNTPGFGISLESETLDHTSAEGGLDEIDASVTLSVARNGQITVDDIQDDTVALFVVGELSDYNQAAATVAAELVAVTGFVPSHYYKAGVSTDNPGGAQLITAPSLALSSDGSVVRANSTAYALGTLLLDGTDLYVATTAGTTDAAAPTYIKAAIGDTTTDGDLVWTYIGTTDALVLDTDYKVEPQNAWFVPLSTSTSKLKQAYDVINGTDAVVKLSIGYTTTATTWTRISTANLASVEAALYYEANNPKGKNRTMIARKVTLSPSGDFQQKTGGDWQSMTFDVSFGKLDSGTPSIIIDGVAVAN